jgi:hypothetical protein
MEEYVKLVEKLKWSLFQMGCYALV